MEIPERWSLTTVSEILSLLGVWIFSGTTHSDINIKLPLLV